MITNEGKLHIKRFLALYVPTIAQSIAVGIGTASESGTDIALQLQVAQTPINGLSYDFVNNQIVFKAAVPDEYVGSIYEVGLYSLPEDPNSVGGSQIITTFDSETEEWTNTGTGAASTYDSTNTRVGIDSLTQTPALNATQTDHLTNLTLDLSNNSAADSFTFAFNVTNANTNAVTVRFLTDGSNYYSFAMGTTVQSSGYKFVSATKGSATVNGSPNWNNITEIQVITTSKSSGPSLVEFDAIRIEDKDSINLDYVLVARKVLASPQVKLDGQAQDIEFALDVTI